MRKEFYLSEPDDREKKSKGSHEDESIDILVIPAVQGTPHAPLAVGWGVNPNGNIRFRSIIGGKRRSMYAE